MTQRLLQDAGWQASITQGDGTTIGLWPPGLFDHITDCLAEALVRDFRRQHQDLTVQKSQHYGT